MPKKYIELASASITDNRDIVISECIGGDGYTVAQKYKVESDNIAFFLKGAIHIKNNDGLYNLRDAVNLAIMKLETKNK